MDQEDAAGFGLYRKRWAIAQMSGKSRANQSIMFRYRSA